jgi:tetratricopeptide (TPR) repeat protein
MNQLVNSPMLRLAQQACQDFEADLSAFVDGELSGLDASKVSDHIEACAGCQAFVHSLAGMTGLHRDVAASSMLDQIGDAAELWADLTQRLLNDNEVRLADVLYELGKALVAAGIRTSPEVRGVRLYREQPGSLQTLTRRGKLLVRENDDLLARSSVRKAGRGRRKGLFPAQQQTTRSSVAFEHGRRCLEESLRLDRNRHEARIYLAQYYRVMGRLDKSRQQIRTVLRADISERLALIALQQLGRVYSVAHQFSKAVEMEREVLEKAKQQEDEVVQVGALANLVIYLVKLGRWDEAEGAVAELVRDFPTHLEGIVAPAFGRARDFRRCLIQEKSFLDRMRSRYPMLFAG